jgi:hypothetical protein
MLRIPARFACAQYEHRADAVKQAGIGRTDTKC